MSHSIGAWVPYLSIKVSFWLFKIFEIQRGRRFVGLGTQEQPQFSTCTDYCFYMHRLLFITINEVLKSKNKKHMVNDKFVTSEGTGCTDKNDIVELFNKYFYKHWKHS